MMSIWHVQKVLVLFSNETSVSPSSVFDECVKRGLAFELKIVSMVGDDDLGHYPCFRISVLAVLYKLSVQIRDSLDVLICAAFSAFIKFS
jgi:hypothetical protein